MAYPRLRPTLNDRRMASLGVVSPVCTDTGHRFIRRYLSQQIGQHGRVAHAVVGDFDGPDLQRVGVNPQVHLGPLPPVLGAVLFAFPLANAEVT